MSELRIIICDVCGADLQHPSWWWQWESYREEGSKHDVHVCPDCESKPFKRNRPPHPRFVALKQAIRALLNAAR